MLDLEKSTFEEFINVENKIKSKQSNNKIIEKIEDFSLQSFLASFEPSYTTNSELKILLKTDLNSKNKSKLG